ncbi:MAG: hypothetical protein SOY43_04070 [Parabacteroides sp.]|nr:hypothetical protein [bacterium]MDY4102056.1 hypothetical protein [Parabacteroides sp.]
MNELDIDKLTRSLLEDQLEKPSSHLNTRIMNQIMQEKRTLQQIQISSDLSIGWLVICCLLISSVGGVIGYLWIWNQPSFQQLQQTMAPYLPYLCTLGMIVSIFLLLDLIGNKMDRKITSRSV